MAKTILFVDLETTSLTVEQAKIKVFGAYDPQTNNYHIYKWNDENLAKVVELLSKYDYIVTFNGQRYDLPILRLHGVQTDFKHLDLYVIIKFRRSGLLRVGGFDSYSLKSLVLKLGLDSEGKKDFDYEILKKDSWTEEEQALITSYLKKDLEITWKLWDYLAKKSEPLKKYLSEKDVDNYKHITSNLTTYTYKVICNGAGIPELYDEKPPHKRFPMIYASVPRRLLETSNVHRLEFNNLVAQTIIQFNLASSNCDCCMNDEGKFHGRNIYFVKGFYCQRKPGKVEEFLKELESDSSVEAKHVKGIVHAHLYDVLINAVYHSTYYRFLPNDLISLIKQQSKYLSKKLEDKGFLVLYVDNDDVFVKIIRDELSVSDLLLVKEEVLEALRNRMPFSNPGFDLELKDQINYIQFFNKGSEKNSAFMYKGQYFYLTSSGEVFSKGVSSDDIQRIMKVVK